MKRALVCLLVPIIVGCAASPVFAAIVFQFASNGNLPSSSFTTSVGSRAAVEVYLQASGDELAQLEAEQLFSSGLLLSILDPSIARVASDLDITGDPAFDIQDKAALSDGATLSVAALGNPFVAPDQGRIRLGMFELTGLAPGTTSFSISDLNPLLDDTRTGVDPGTVFDGLLGSTSASITVEGNVSAVPEPSSIVVMGGLFASFGFWLYRRKRVENR